MLVQQPTLTGGVDLSYHQTSETQFVETPDLDGSRYPAEHMATMEPQIRSSDARSQRERLVAHPESETV